MQERKAREKQKKEIRRSKNEAQDKERRKQKRRRSDQVVGETPGSSSWAPWPPALIQGSFRKQQNRKVHDAGGDTVTIDRWRMADAIRQGGMKQGRTIWPLPSRERSYQGIDLM